MRYSLKPGSKVSLKNIDPNDSSLFEGDKEAGKTATLETLAKLEELQELMYAEHKHKMIVVLQGMDTSGKDGTIRTVFDGVNPTGVRVASFKAPSSEELDHDYLWRIHQQVPRRGEITIFNRSHYEDVLIVRVHELVPKGIWSKRFAQINDFERMLTEEGTKILKFFLHIDKEEQKERLEARLAEKEKSWKFNIGDLKERALWDTYQKAYEDVLTKTTTDWAPWYVIPANKKWYRNWLIAKIIVEALEEQKMQFPPPAPDLDKIIVE